MTIVLLIVMGIVLFGFSEWAKHELEKERKARVSYVSAKQNSKVDFCSECYYKKTVTYSTVEKLWLCEGCK
jgi:predicted negative regulator of RcsB-dependent stress response